MFFIIYIDDLPNNLISSFKVFPDDLSRFSTVHDTDASRTALNNDLKKLSEWVYKWKMQFNPDINKQVQKIIYSRKTLKSAHPSSHFDDAPVTKSNVQKHVGLSLEKRKNFNHHIKKNVAIYKSFARSQLDYGGMVNLIMINFARELKACSIILLRQLLEQLRECPKQN